MKKNNVKKEELQQFLKIPIKDVSSSIQFFQSEKERCPVHFRVFQNKMQGKIDLLTDLTHKYRVTEVSTDGIIVSKNQPEKHNDNLIEGIIPDNRLSSLDDTEEPEALKKPIDIKRKLDKNSTTDLLINSIGVILVLAAFVSVFLS